MSTFNLQNIQYLNRKIFHVHIITLTNNGILLPETIRYANRYACIDKKVAIDPFSLYKLRAYLVNNRIDIVHCHDWITALYILLSAKGLSIKKIITIHSQAKSWRNNLSYFILKRFEKIITVSRHQKLNFFEKGIPWEKMVVNYNCYNSQTFKAINKNKRPSDQHPFRIVMVGNFSWQKDQMTLIDAMGSLYDKGHNIELHLIGGREPKRKEECQFRVQNKNLNEIVFFHEQIKVDGRFLSKFDLFAFSTKSETFGIVLLEAMASGLPVLVSDIPSSMELIRYGSDGFYFETANSDDCANKIKEIINNPIETQHKKESGYKRASEFTPEVIVRELEKCYEDILS